MVNRIYILTLHRSGSTWLQNILETSNEVRFARDEINAFEPLRLRTLDKYWQYGFNKSRFLKDYKTGKIYGSFFRKEDSRSIISTINSLQKESNIWDFMVIYSCNFRNRYYGYKYPCHVRKFKELYAFDPQAKYIFLRRNIHDLYMSKINDGSLSTDKFGHWVYRIYALMYFCWSYVVLSKTISRFGRHALVIEYDMICNNLGKTLNTLETFLNLRDGSLNGNVKGKTSSFSRKTNSEILSLISFERIVLFTIEKLCERRFTL